jgi:hypothetical protein
MSNRAMKTDDQLETHRALVKLLQYVEDECMRIGYSATGWMIAMSRNTLHGELTGCSTLHFDELGYPQLN